MDVDDLIYLEQLVKRSYFAERGFNIVYANKIAGYTCKEIAEMHKALGGRCGWNRDVEDVQRTMRHSIKHIQREHEIEKYWGRV